MKTRSRTLALAVLCTLCAPAFSYAQAMSNGEKMPEKMLPEGTYTTYEVTITNLTGGQPFSPPVVVAHSPDMHLFELGKPVSPQLQKVAEEGMGGDLVKMCAGKATDIAAAGMDQKIMPGKSLKLMIKVKPGDVVSVVNMVAATNDTFTGVDGCPVDEEGMKAMHDRMEKMGGKGGDMKGDMKGEMKGDMKSDGMMMSGDRMMKDGTCTIMAMAFDAGTEENTEKKSDTAAPDMGKGHPATEPQQPTSISKGIMGVGDLDKEKFGWSGPVEKIEIKKAMMAK